MSVVLNLVKRSTLSGKHQADHGLLKINGWMVSASKKMCGPEPLLLLMIGQFPNHLTLQFESGHMPPTTLTECLLTMSFSME